MFGNCLTVIVWCLTYGDKWDLYIQSTFVPGVCLLICCLCPFYLIIFFIMLECIYGLRVYQFRLVPFLRLLVLYVFDVVLFFTVPPSHLQPVEVPPFCKEK